MKPFSDTLWLPGQPQSPTATQLSPQELTDRLMYLEKLIANPTLDQLPMADIKRSLLQTWQPDPATLLGGVLTTDLMPTVPHVVVERPASQSIANNSFTATEDIVWSAMQTGQDFASMWAAGAGVTIRVPGIYAMSVGGGFGGFGAATTHRKVAIMVNGAELRETDAPISSATVTSSPSCATTRRLALNDIVTMRAFQDSGAALGITNNLMSVTWIGH